MTDLHDRRSFLRSAAVAGAAWLTADFVQVEDALAWAAQHAASGDFAALTVLTPGQASALDAMASRILPAVDGRPGAHEAGVVYFVDRALGTFAKDQVKAYQDGVEDLNRRAARHDKRQAGFAELTIAQQNEILRSIESTPFFQTVRVATLVGAFALPSYGGNRDYAGWHLIGLEHQPRFDAPFGYYDAEVNRKG